MTIKFKQYNATVTTLTEHEQRCGHVIEKPQPKQFKPMQDNPEEYRIIGVNKNGIPIEVSL